MAARKMHTSTIVALGSVPIPASRRAPRTLMFQQQQQQQLQQQQQQQ
jgi:hypothetical protein